MKKLRNLTEEEELQIFNERKSGNKRKDILSKWCISDRHYKDIILKNGGELNSKVNKYNFKENYFEKIDTEDKAYFLGFIIADGSINSLTNNIQITQKDPHILYEFKKYIEYGGNIYKNKNRNVFDIKFSSGKMKLDLEKMGIKPNKTMDIKYPDIPEYLQNHFMRGFFDGDGCISIRVDKRYDSVRGQFNICSGSYDFIKDYYDKLVNYCDLGGKNKIRCPKGTYYVCDWGSLTDVENIYHFLYNDATIFLKRKKETFDKVVSITKNRKKYRK